MRAKNDQLCAFRRFPRFLGKKWICAPMDIGEPRNIRVDTEFHPYKDD